MLYTTLVLEMTDENLRVRLMISAQCQQSSVLVMYFYLMGL